MKRALIPVVIVVAAMSVATAASAFVDDVPDIAEDAALDLGLEAALLVELGCWPADLPVEIADEYDFNAEFFADLTRIDLMAWLYEVDQSNAGLLTELRTAGAPIGPDLAAALGPLPRGSRAAIEDGRMVPIQPIVYRRALLELTHLRAGPPPTVTTVPVATTSVAPAVRVVTPTTVGAPATTAAAITTTTVGILEAGDDADSAGSAWILLLVAAVGVVVVGGIAVLARARRGRSDAPSLDRLLDAGRRMTAALDQAQVAQIARSESVAVTDARFGAFLLVDGDDIAVGCADPGLFHEEALGDGVLGRVAATGQTRRDVCRDEPSLASLPVSLLAAPVIGQGRVVGLLVVVRDATSPFGEGEQHALEQLAPMVGSAVAAAGRHRDVTELSEVDALTGLANRRRFDADLASLADGRSPFGLAMIDVDHFKTFNDSNGHAAGDAALRAVAAAIRSSLRSDDRAYRYGGEEFAVLVDESSADLVSLVVERARVAVETASVAGEEHQPGGRLTISVGVFSGVTSDPDGAVRTADAALYQAKEEGRNRVVVDGRLPRSA